MRDQTRLPVALADRFDQVADLDGYLPAFLLCHWLTVAIEVLEQGRGDLLPPIAGLPRGTVGATREYRFTRSRAETERSRRVFAAAGLEPVDVARTAVRLYV